MHKSLSLPFGINLEVTPRAATVTSSRLEREFYVPTDDFATRLRRRRRRVSLRSAGCSGRAWQGRLSASSPRRTARPPRQRT